MSRLDAISDWIDKGRNSHYDSSALATSCGVSVSQLRRYFATNFYRPPQDWLDELRIWDAARLLCEGQRVKETCYALGFNDTAHFCHRFRAYHRCAPSVLTCLHRERIIRLRSRFAAPLAPADAQFIPPEPWALAEVVLDPNRIHSRSKGQNARYIQQMRARNNDPR
jgi:AraC-like DNA-binding protein